MARDKDKEREREHLFTSEQDVRRARRHHRDRRRESERAERPTTAAGAEVLGLDELRAVRAAYYLRPEEERRARTPKRMTQEVERERQRELERVEAMVKSRRETERRQGGETKRRKEKKLEERDEDVASAEFVYGRPEARRSTRSVRENSPDGETRWVVRTTDGERVSGTRSIRRSVDTFQDEGGSSRRAAEGEPRSRSRAERRGVSPEQTGHRTVSRTISVRRVNTPKLHRYA
ncbi:hypothetical protein K432DRAFT_89386 [Lepidopterella palustris CBS 459.81]|uniref:Uncharacterized protein n=1 Tax=Lepidopterella palustris CBS 459.81 TaxID=1314670 RepID=A0A8E2E7I2_9PEZI|nr:hypothetical protein K432DRAFT_89386 [Lepidopterella palustris CBS 459.81]